MIRRFREGLHAALAFLSRLVPPPAQDAASLDRAVPFYPLAGLVLGLLAASPYVFVPGDSWAAAWLYALLLAWLTRGLHWDGIADLADACGSNKRGEDFWRVMKDSRIGAFGVMALVFGITGQVLAAHACAATGRWPVLLLAPALGRAMVIALARLTAPYPGSTLAARIRPGAVSRAAATSLFLTWGAAFVLLEFTVFLPAALLAGLCVYILTRLAAAHGGANGDFHGTLIIVVETAVLCAAALAPGL